MSVANSIFDHLNPNIIFVVLAVIFAAVKSFIERGKNDDEPEITQQELDDYAAYEEALRQEQAKFQIPTPSELPPPLPATSVSSVPPASPRVKKTIVIPAEKRVLSEHKRDRTATRSRLHRHLSSPTAAREALVLAEVLGPPKALQAQDNLRR